MRITTLAAALLACLALAGCGGGSSGTGEGALLQGPTLTLTANADQFTSSLAAQGASGLGLLGLSTGDPSGQTALSCGVVAYHYEYITVDAQGKPATASGALMLPSGTSATCSGARPLLEYAHGTTLDQNYDIAALNDTSNPAYSEAALIASMYAAQGYIVVAPNYVGYDTSDVAYHPYLVKAQQSSDMIDALTAARLALAQLGGPVTPSSKFFLTGYSQGGYVALATEQAMQQRGMTVTAASPGSGPYALAALVDYIFMGHPDAGAPQLGSLLVQAYQASYGNVYTTPSQVFANNLYTPLPYLTTAAATDSALTQTTPMFLSTAPTTGDVTVLPADAGASANATLSAVFPYTVPGGATYATPGVIAQSVWTEFFDTLGTLSPSTPYNAYATALAPLWASYFAGSGNLIAQGFRADYLADALINPDGLLAGSTGRATTSAGSAFRQDLAANDLRGYVPNAPTMLCGGFDDPTVYYPLDTSVMQTEWGTPSSTRFAFDVDPQQASESTGPSAPYAAIQTAFQAWKNTQSATALVGEYHGEVSGYCALAARDFFAQF